MDDKMMTALEVDGEKLRQLTGEDHGPWTWTVFVDHLGDKTYRRWPNVENHSSGYEMYRGKCKQMATELALQDPSLTLVRGYYYCTMWGEQAHWWCKKPDGTIVDPTKDQFPSHGNGQYVEFDGMVRCSQCGKEMKEEEAEYESNYCFCSYECHGRFVGVL